MCGIAGIFSSETISETDSEKFSNLLDEIKYRGPDDKGLYKNDHVLIGHRRLSIIDPTSGGSQPMLDEDQRFVLSYNGECYNYRELKVELEKDGIEFKSASDTEVVFQLLIKHGIEGVSKINGFFSIAFCDIEKEQLYLARDRFGIKPLYYAFDENKFIFGSELNVIMSISGKAEIDSDSLQTYIHTNYIPSPNSMLENVHKLKPGKTLTIDKSLDLQEKTYYSINRNKIKFEKSIEKEIVDRLESSVEKRLVSDVPIGCFLSGGIDSSAITALASRHIEKLKTYTVVFKDQKQYDEGPYADLVSKRFNTEHTEIEIKEEDILASIPQLLSNINEPFADSSSIAMYHLCKSVKPYAKVALSGDGGDELFAGYRKHLAAFYAFQYPSFSKFLSLSSSAISKLPKSRKSGFLDKVRKLDRFASAASTDPIERYWHWLGFGNPSKNLLNESSQFALKNTLLETVDLAPENMDKSLEADIQMVLEGDMLVKTDRMSMLHSMEVRVPFLDHEFVDFANSIPAKFKIDFNQSKKLLRSSFSNVLPSEILNKKKQGFEVPILKWLKSDLNETMENILNQEVIENMNIFNLEEVQRLKKKLFSNNSNNSEYALWNLMVFTSWHQNFIREAK